MHPPQRSSDEMPKPDLPRAARIEGAVMTYAQLAGRRQRILREIEQAQREAANVDGRLRRLREEFELIEFQIASRCIPRLTEVVATRTLEAAPARGVASAA